MNTRIEKMTEFHNEPINVKQSMDVGVIAENKYLNIMMVLAKLVDETISLPASEELYRDVILAEYVEGIQFILQLGEECGFENDLIEEYAQLRANGEISNQFMQVLEAVLLFRIKKSAIMYRALFYQYLQLGKLLNITLEEIEQSLKREANESV